jgi:NitT/TauT family transport system substrate-binding protein
MVAVVVAGCGSASTPSAIATTSPSVTAGASSVASPSPSGLQPPEVTKIRIGISTLEANTFVPKFAADEGLYAKYGITDAEVLYFEGSQRNLTAIIADQTEVASDAPQTTLTSLTSEAPLQDIAIYANGFLDCIVTSGSITTGDQLKGKRVAISQLGGQSHAEVQVALQSLGLTTDDVSLVQVGGQSARVSALQAGSVDAIPVDCTIAPDLAGMNILVKLADVGIDFPTSNLSLKRSFIEKNPNTVLAIAAANLEAMQLLFTEEDRAIASLAAWGQIDPADAKTALDAFKALAKRDLVPTAAGYEEVKKTLEETNPEVANVDSTQAFTTSFLDQLKAIGLNDELQVP